MNPDQTISPHVAFPLAAAISGFASGISYNLICPGLFFGIAMAVAIHHTIGSMRLSSALIFIAMSTFGFILAGVAALVAAGRLGLGNGFVGGSIVVFISGAVGAGMIALALAISSKSFQSLGGAVAISLTGGVCGAAFAIPIHWHDQHQLAHPLDFILEFMMWQMGVGAAIPLTKISPDEQPPEMQTVEIRD